jgi:hypothetical protein
MVSTLWENYSTGTIIATVIAILNQPIITSAMINILIIRVIGMMVSSVCSSSVEYFGSMALWIDDPYPGARE